MTEEQMATFIADRVVEEINNQSSFIGLIGVAIGAALTIVGNIILHMIQQSRQNKNDTDRKVYLKDMLDDKGFKDGRSLETLSKVTGTNPEDCRRLLVELKARGFTMSDGREGWTYIKNRPLNEQ